MFLIRIYTIKEKFDHKAFIENSKGVFLSERILQKQVKTADNCRYLLNIQPIFSKNEAIMSGLLSNGDTLGNYSCKN